MSIGTGQNSGAFRGGKGRRNIPADIKMDHMDVRMTINSEKIHLNMLRQTHINNMLRHNRLRQTYHSMLQTTEDYAKYFRLNVEHGLGTVTFDKWKGKKGDKTLPLIRTKTEEYLKSPDVKRDIAEIAKQLVEVRRQRSTWEPDLDRWERFCHGVEYACPVSTCSDGAKRHKARRSLRDHLKEIHSIEPDELEPLLDEGKRFPLDEVPE